MSDVSKTLDSFSRKRLSGLYVYILVPQRRYKTMIAGVIYLEITDVIKSTLRGSSSMQPRDPRTKVGSLHPRENLARYMTQDI